MPTEALTWLPSGFGFRVLGFRVSGLGGFWGFTSQGVDRGFSPQDFVSEARQ